MSSASPRLMRWPESLRTLVTRRRSSAQLRRRGRHQQQLWGVLLLKDNGFTCRTARWSQPWCLGNLYRLEVAGTRWHHRGFRPWRSCGCASQDASINERPRLSKAESWPCTCPSACVVVRRLRAQPLPPLLDGENAAAPMESL
jgi:hypothetical protein